jgi:hypothetical protein
MRNLERASPHAIKSLLDKPAHSVGPAHYQHLALPVALGKIDCQSRTHLGVYEKVVGKQAKRGYPHLYIKKTRTERGTLTNGNE